MLMMECLIKCCEHSKRVTSNQLRVNQQITAWKGGLSPRKNLEHPLKKAVQTGETKGRPAFWVRRDLPWAHISALSWNGVGQFILSLMWVDVSLVKCSSVHMLTWPSYSHRTEGSHKVFARCLGENSGNSRAWELCGGFQMFPDCVLSLSVGES